MKRNLNYIIYEIHENIHPVEDVFYEYNGSYNIDDDPADYIRPIKAVQIA